MAGLTVGWKFGGRLNRGFPSLVAPLEDIEELLLDRLVFPTLAAANLRRSFGISKGKSLKGTSSFLLLCSPYSMLIPLSEPWTSPSLGGPGRMWWKLRKSSWMFRGCSGVFWRARAELNSARSCGELFCERAPFSEEGSWDLSEMGERIWNLADWMSDL